MSTLTGKKIPFNVKAATDGKDTYILNAKESVIGRVPSAHLENAELTRSDVAKGFVEASQRLGVSPETTNRNEVAALSKEVSTRLNILVQPV